MRWRDVCRADPATWLLVALIQLLGVIGLLVAAHWGPHACICLFGPDR